MPGVWRRSRHSTAPGALGAAQKTGHKKPGTSAGQVKENQFLRLFHVRTQVQLGQIRAERIVVNILNADAESFFRAARRCADHARALLELAAVLEFPGVFEIERDDAAIDETVAKTNCVEAVKDERRGGLFGGDDCGDFALACHVVETIAQRLFELAHFLTANLKIVWNRGDIEGHIAKVRLGEGDGFGINSLNATCGR